MRKIKRLLHQLLGHSWRKERFYMVLDVDSGEICSVHVEICRSCNHTRQVKGLVDHSRNEEFNYQ